MRRQAASILFAAIFFVSFGCISILTQNLEFHKVYANAEPEVQWLWGEVVSVDINAKQAIVKYLDYETDSEKEISIFVDEKTAYENANSLGEIKPQNTVSIDYIANSDGKNIAKNISLEKPEDAQIPQEGNVQEESKATAGLEE